ncbi:AbrB/MazE/SpoVT family DNA-binding domain-containing protein [Candidatus Bathyarchaeota archaeon]|nr:AbrB/MazE/SpoVT family DNA-binding domain-containing protein [Candidatus Bathyarchaeota archaeon]
MGGISLKVRKKGVIILPKSLRKAANIGEGDDVLVEVKDGIILMKVFKPRVVDVEPELIEKLLEEEVKLEEG